MRIVFYLAVLCLPLLAKAQDTTLIDSALAQVGMTHNDVKFDADELATWGGDQWRLSFFTMLHKNPFKLPRYGKMNLEACSTDIANLPSLVANGGRKIDCPVLLLWGALDQARAMLGLAEGLSFALILFVIGLKIWLSPLLNRVTEAR